MKNKGFTMVELLAVLVILGILMGIGLPVILNVIETSRQKVYITDAKKMVALAENKLKRTDFVIEQPERDNFIVLSLNFLDDGTFENSPHNNGSYLYYSSFVLIKNNDDELEYYVTIVEKVSDGYKGLPLTKIEDLKKRDAYKKVTIMEKADGTMTSLENTVISVGGVDGYYPLDGNYIKDNLEGYDDAPTIDYFYNFENTQPDDSEPPVEEPLDPEDPEDSEDSEDPDGSD